MVKNGQKWPEMGFFHLQSFANAPVRWRACFSKNVFLAPTFLGAGGGPIRYFFCKNGTKMDKNGHKWPEMGFLDLQSFANARPNWRACS